MKYYAKDYDVIVIGAGHAGIEAGLAAARQICDYFATGCTKYQVNK